MADTDGTAHIENTAERDPLLHLICTWADGSDTYITDMETDGQRQLVHSDRLPVDLNGGKDDDYLALGFTFGEPDPGDPMFRPATLPDGWRRESSDHAMWSYLVDANGRRRVAVFYKAAFYDRRAHMNINTVDDEVFDLLWSEDETRRPVIDEWTTREVWIKALTEYRDRALVEAADEESYYPAGAERKRKHAARCDVLLAELAVSA